MVIENLLSPAGRGGRLKRWWRGNISGIPVKDLRLLHSPHEDGGKIDGSSNSSDKRRRSHGVRSSSRVGWGIGGLG